MTPTRPTGHVAHCAPGSLMLTRRAAELLASHLDRLPRPTDHETARVIADIKRMARPRPTSRNRLPAMMLAPADSKVSTSQAAHLLGLSPAGIRKRINRGTLPAEFDGNRWWIDRDNLEGRTAA